MANDEVMGVVLASGHGRRMGGPKALLMWDGVPLAQAHALAWASCCRRVVIVTRSDIAASLPPGLDVVISTEEDALGPAGSLAAAARHLEGDAHWLVTPVDCPPVRRETCSALIEALGEAVAARPRHGARRGHPVALRAEVWQRYRREARPLRDVLHEVGDRVAEVAVDDDGVLRDLDSPDDLPRPPAFFDSGHR